MVAFVFVSQLKSTVAKLAQSKSGQVRFGEQPQLSIGPTVLLMGVYCSSSGVDKTAQLVTVCAFSCASRGTLVPEVSTS